MEKVKPLFKAKGVPDEEIILAELIATQEKTGGKATRFRRADFDINGAKCFCAIGALDESRNILHSYNTVRNSKAVDDMVAANDRPDAELSHGPWSDIGRTFQSAYETE